MKVLRTANLKSIFSGSCKKKRKKQQYEGTTIVLKVWKELPLIFSVIWSFSKRHTDDPISPFYLKLIFRFPFLISECPFIQLQLN